MRLYAMVLSPVNQQGQTRNKQGNDAMSYYTPEKIPDDPGRTADYGYFPWELEGDRPHVSETEAINRVIHVLEGKAKRAFGGDDHCWEEDLCSNYLVEKYRPLVIALLKNDATTLDKIGDYLRGCIARHADDWLAEADYDELEREGWI